MIAPDQLPDRPRIVITGMGAVTPLGVGAETLHRRWTAGEVAITDGIARCQQFDADDFLSRREIVRSSRFTHLALAACIEATTQAGWEDELPYDPTRVSCVVGTIFGGQATFSDDVKEAGDARTRLVGPLAVPRAMHNAAAAMITMHYQVTGESFGLAGACAAGAQAIGVGMRMLQSGQVDAAIVGGTEAEASQIMIDTYRSLGAASPSGTCRPFDARRDGMVPGEGAGILVLERENDALQRGAQVLGRIRGYGSSSDAFHLTTPRPDGEGPRQAMAAALADAGITAADVAYVNAHGTGTKQNDSAEVRALKGALGEEAYTVPISSLKSSIGHLQGAAGAVEAIATLLALREGVAPPTLNLESPDEALGLNFVPLRTQALGNSASRIGLNSSFGLGGHNAVVVLSCD